MKVTTAGPASGGIVGSAGNLLERAAWRAGVAAGRRLRQGRITAVLPDGSRYVFGDRDSEQQAELRVYDRQALVRMLVGGSTGAGEAYMDGQWSSPDLAELLRLAAVNSQDLALSADWWRVPSQLRRTLAHRTRRNTRGGARRNIAAHYDLGNEFYRLFLDETLTYSCAVFEAADQPLADAQRNKYRRIAVHAGLQPGMHVLEIGCGWGGFSLYAATELGCRVTAITISREQHALATERVAEAGLSELVSIELRDYRDVQGTYDAVVSIEMLEAVGAKYLPAFFEACDRALRPGGRLGLQVITMPDATYDSQLRGANWIQTYIFPGGLCPSLAAIEQANRRTNLLIRDVDDIAASYVLTLRAWRARFMSQLDAVRAMGFDDRFIRMWEYYLALSEASFAAGMTQDLQISFQKRRLLA